ncbi:hypothetical protein CYMTET_11512 [Cymbomonas tetramitiformis]|uniref:Uncharacterized protein n=1 Tax=Cymbomonas tetramitiformis TaxID=36881 RepID=A0AAE0GM53_9CHLO|nr:hypothetical protein CYMTET_11512 [Cymbomonas tetramitiformis]
MSTGQLVSEKPCLFENNVVDLPKLAVSDPLTQCCEVSDDELGFESSEVDQIFRRLRDRQVNAQNGTASFRSQDLSDVKVGDPGKLVESIAGQHKSCIATEMSRCSEPDSPRYWQPSAWKNGEQLASNTVNAFGNKKANTSTEVEVRENETKGRMKEREISASASCDQPVSYTTSHLEDGVSEDLDDSVVAESCLECGDQLVSHPISDFTDGVFEDLEDSIPVGTQHLEHEEQLVSHPTSEYEVFRLSDFTDGVSEELQDNGIPDSDHLKDGGQIFSRSGSAYEDRASEVPSKTLVFFSDGLKRFRKSLKSTLLDSVPRLKALHQADISHVVNNLDVDALDTTDPDEKFLSISTKNVDCSPSYQRMKKRRSHAALPGYSKPPSVTTTPHHHIDQKTTLGDDKAKTHIKSFSFTSTKRYFSYKTWYSTGVFARKVRH